MSSTRDELDLEHDEEEGIFVPIESPEEVKAAAERERIASSAHRGGVEVQREVAVLVELPEQTVRRHLNSLLEARPRGATRRR